MKQATVRRIVSVGLLVSLCLFFGLTRASFLTKANITTLLRDASIVGIVAVGMTFVIITAGIDLSVGSILALVAMLCANLLAYSHVSVLLVVLIAVVAGLIAGQVNGLLVARLHLPDFVATLATMGIFRGLTLLIAIRTNGQITNKVIHNNTFINLDARIGSLYIVTIAFAAIAALGQLVLKRTKLGVYTYAVGAYRKSADMSGINSDLIKWTVYALSGLCSAIAAIFLTARTQAALPEMGIGLEFDAIAAVVIGGCAFSGGRGDVVGSLIGALFMTALVNGIYKYNLPTAVQLLVKGGVVVAMVVFDSAYRRLMEEKARKPERRTPHPSSVASDA